MKKIVLSLLTFAAVVFGQFSVNQSVADNIPVDVARKVGLNFMNQFMDKAEFNEAEMELVYAIPNRYNGMVATYIFNISDRCWVAVAGNDYVHPIVACATEGIFDPETVSPELMWNLEISSENIAGLQNNDEKYIPDAKTTQVWQNLKSSRPQTKASYRHILTYISWEQGNPVRPSYNKFCPVITTLRIDSTASTRPDTVYVYDTIYTYDTVIDTVAVGDTFRVDTTVSVADFVVSETPVDTIYSTVRYYIYDTTRIDSTCYVGCVATAMSQIIRYWRYPVSPTGRVSTDNPSNPSERLTVKLDTVRYNFSLMPDTLRRGSSQAEIDEVAKLCYHAGLSVQMGYGVDGSGAYSFNVSNALMTKFKYNDGIRMVYRNSTSIDNYVNMLRTDLMAGRPVYMGGASATGGRDADGHAWFCDGYMTGDDATVGQMYHMNWGWGPNSKSWNNVYTNNMSINGYNFNLRQEIIYGIQPPADSLGINDVCISLDGSAYPNPARTVINIPYTVSQSAVMSIYTIDGRLVETLRLQPESNVATVKVDSYPSGVYIYRLNGETRKFIVQ